MPDPAVESFDNPRSNLPNTYAQTIVAREIDFVTRFGRNWDRLRELMGIMRPIRKAPGTTLSQVKASVTLADGDVDYIVDAFAESMRALESEGVA